MHRLKLKIVFQCLNAICHCVGMRSMVLVMLLLLLLYHQLLGSAQYSASTQLLHNLAANILLHRSASRCKIAINQLLCCSNPYLHMLTSNLLLIQVERDLFQDLHAYNYCNYLQFVVLKEVQVLTLLWTPQWTVGLLTLSSAHNCAPNLA